MSYDIAEMVQRVYSHLNAFRKAIAATHTGIQRPTKNVIKKTPTLRSRSHIAHALMAKTTGSDLRVAGCQ